LRIADCVNTKYTKAHKEDQRDNPRMPRSYTDRLV
jgi:hypothetical protein